MRSRVARWVRALDDRWARWSVDRMGEGDGLVSVLFHTLLEDERELEQDLLHPQQRTTVAHLRGFLERFLEAGYSFLSPADLLAAGPDLPGRHAVLTFDDGYCNNRLALPILRELGVPALLFVTTGHVDAQKAFWWDVVWRERRRRGETAERIDSEIASLKARSPEAIDAHLVAEFGSASLHPVADLDRPFTADELTELSRQPEIHLGNHTTDHAILTLLEPADIERRIRGAQDRLREITGAPPVAIAYPNGDLSPGVLTVTRDLGLRLGWTLQPRKERPAAVRLPGRELAMGRFVVWGDRDLDEQCRLFRSDRSLYTLLKGGGRN